MIGLEEVRRSRNRREAEQQALVLAAMGIGSQLVVGPGGVEIHVAAADADAARGQLEAYERENAARRPAAVVPRTDLDGWPGSAVYTMVLLFFFGAERRDLWSVDWLAAGAAQAGAIAHNAWFRTFTALTLHADHGHLLGNLLAGAVIGTLAAQLLGQGLAWLGILLAGALGNLLAALLRAPDHAAIGASTAVFGALGIVSAYTRQRRWLERHLGLRRQAPLGAGVLLLAYLGFGGERTDVGAHVMGFAVGLGMGWTLARWFEHVPRGPRAQWAYGSAAAALLVLAWVLALGTG
ncbi:MAG: rhomboid family intramembrane serine protease [Geminicoccaceae bacterium]